MRIKSRIILDQYADHPPSSSDFCCHRIRRKRANSRGAVSIAMRKLSRNRKRSWRAASRNFAADVVAGDSWSAGSGKDEVGRRWHERDGTGSHREISRDGGFAPDAAVGSMLRCTAKDRGDRKLERLGRSRQHPIPTRASSRTHRPDSSEAETEVGIGISRCDDGFWRALRR